MFAENRESGLEAFFTIVEDGSERQVPSTGRFILDDDFSFQSTSTFNSIVDGAIAAPLALARQILEAKGVDNGLTSLLSRTSSREFGFQYWSSSSPLSLNIKSTFYMRTSGLRDVMTPIKEITRLAIPTVHRNGSGLIPPGPNISIVLDSDEEIAVQSNSTRRTHLQIGQMTLEDIIIKSVTNDLSKVKDDQGWPVWGTISVDVDTVYTFDSRLLDQMIPDLDV